MQIKYYLVLLLVILLYNAIVTDCLLAITNLQMYRKRVLKQILLGNALELLNTKDNKSNCIVNSIYACAVELLYRVSLAKNRDLALGFLRII